MSRPTFAAVMSTLALTIAPLTAHADEQMRSLAESGDWAASAHYESMTSAPDVCVAGSAADASFGFRAEDGSFAIRITNAVWSLPANVAGSVAIVIGTWKKSLDIDANTSNSLNVPIQNSELVEMFSNMDKAASMDIAVGKAKPFRVSLVGSTVATNAFRTCAGLHSNGPTAPGSNPFQ